MKEASDGIQLLQQQAGDEETEAKTGGRSRVLAYRVNTYELGLVSKNDSLHNGQVNHDVHGPVNHLAGYKPGSNPQ